LLDILTSKQVSEWEAYDRIDPIGEYRNDTRTALVCSTITNLMRSIWGKKGSKMSSLSDFILQWGNEKKVEKKQTPEQMRDAFFALTGLKKKK